MSSGSAVIEAIRYSTYLEVMALEIKKSRSGEKSTLKLFAAGARLLENTAYRDLNVEEICAEANLAKGTFYIYFQSKEMFLEELARRYVGFEAQTYPVLFSVTSNYLANREWIAWYERTFVSNAGLIRCLVQMCSQSAAMQELWHQRNKNIADRIVSDVQRRHGLSQDNLPWVRTVIRTAGGMLDQSLFERFRVHIGPGREPDVDPRHVVDLHAILVFRAFYGRNPPTEEVGEAADLLREITFPISFE